MGKRLQDLHLNDDPIEHTVESLEALHQHDGSTTPDDRDQPWYQFLGDIDDLLATNEYGWAYESLHGIYETVERTHRVTPGQRRAVTNIENGGEQRRATEAVSSRRYEGYYRSRR